MMNNRSVHLESRAIWEDTVKVPMRPCKKRKPQEIIDYHTEKRQKMDRSVKQQCSMILKTLMTHPAGWVFNKPVDPVALEIPDYFSIITEPMDLGTIKRKLEDCNYLSVYEFAADIRLTFSNAMKYNPPSNNVHRMAQQLDNIFSRRWKSLEGRGCSESKNLDQECKLQSKVKNSQEVEKIPRRKLTKAPLDKGLVKVDAVKIAEKRRHENPKKIVHKATVTDKTACSSADTRQSLRSVDRHACTYEASVSSFERPVTPFQQCQIAAKKDCEEKNTLTSNVSRSDQDSSDVRKSDQDSQRIHEIQLSPKLALRAAMLKSRFAETIFKAIQEKHLNVKEADPETIQQEKERFKRQQQEEKARLDAEIAASRLKAEEEFKTRREREREAARIALQKMEKTVEIYDNFEILKYAEMLMFKDSIFPSPLKQLGLFMKLEDKEEGEMQRFQLDYCEEGEILS